MLNTCAAISFGMCLWLLEIDLEMPYTLLELLFVIPRKADLVSSVKLTFLFVKSR